MIGSLQPAHESLLRGTVGSFEAVVETFVVRRAGDGQFTLIEGVLSSSSPGMMICGGGGAPPIVMVGGEGSTLIEGGDGLPLIEGPRPRGSSSPGRTILGAAGGSSGSTIWGTAGDSGRTILGASTFEGADTLVGKSPLLPLPLRLVRMIRGPPRRPATETGGGSSKSMSRASVGLGRVGEGCRMGGTRGGCVSEGGNEVAVV